MTVTFHIDIVDLAYWDVGVGQFVIEPGQYWVEIGRSSVDITGSATFDVTAVPPSARDASSRLVRAVDFDGASGIHIIDEAPAAGDAVAARGSGAWLRYRDVELHDVDRAVAQMATSGAEPAAIEFRLGDPLSGPRIGRLEVEAVEGKWRWRTVEGPARASGRHDLYVLLSDQAQLASFSLLGAGSVIGSESM